MKEKWTDVVGFVGFYRVSSLGRILSKHRKGKILSPCPCSKKVRYLTVSLSKHGKVKNMMVHRIVLESFVGPCPDGMECLHKDGNVQNNKLRNLRWGTPIENATDRELHGKTAKGWKIGASKTVIERRRAIMDLHTQCGYSVEVLAAVFSKPEMTIRYLIATYDPKVHDKKN